MKDGIDIRDTLRHWYEGDIYVKVLPPNKGQLDAAVMLFDSPADPREYPWRTTWFAEHKGESTLAFFRGRANMAAWYRRRSRACVSRLRCRWLLHGRTTSRVLERLRRLGSRYGQHAQLVSGAVLAVHMHTERCRERPVWDPYTGPGRGALGPCSRSYGAHHRVMAGCSDSFARCLDPSSIICKGGVNFSM